ncbi:hypothetical protein ASF03_12965 [Rhizobium sp. Leaf68]|nr:hypothetical protein ASE62_12285 [Rhizobium sp. Leaf202]KQN84170.1 hypothetical protein ASF03_12965 [Rhizobium sp. Leaf68]
MLICDTDVASCIAVLTRFYQENADTLLFQPARKSKANRTSPDDADLKRYRCRVERVVNHGFSFLQTMNTKRRSCSRYNDQILSFTLYPETA